MADLSDEVEVITPPMVRRIARVFRADSLAAGQRLADLVGAGGKTLAQLGIQVVPAGKKLVNVQVVVSADVVDA